MKKRGARGLRDIQSSHIASAAKDIANARRNPASGRFE
jgi:hypothetical protein